MTHFRFRHKQVACQRWRHRTAHRRAFRLVLPLVGNARQAPATAAWRRTAPAFVPMPSVAVVLHIGKFVVSEAGDPQLHGHPDIRY